MDLTGGNLIAGRESGTGGTTFRATDPATGQELDPVFHEATGAEIDEAARAAEEAAPGLAVAGTARAALLRAVAEEILALGGALIERAAAETGLPPARLEGERGRTVNQLRLFADLVEEGSWVDARIDRALPERQPLPRPDLRRMLVPLGPVAVFGASNFPLAFSVAGGDTASALAAGCPVVVKAHPAHPGTSELVGRAVQEAVHRTGMPAGSFSMLHGASVACGQDLVSHAAIQAVAFTGSFAGGRALLDASCRRPRPVPVLAEMGSANPVFLLPEAVATRRESLVRGLAGSVTLGTGQFCTNPGLTVLERSARAEELLAELGAALAATPAGTMCHAGIRSAYESGLEGVSSLPGVRLAARAEARGPNPLTEGRAALLVTTQQTWLSERRLREEIYGPVTVAVLCDGAAGLEEVARALEGHLVSCVHGTPGDLARYTGLLTHLSRRAGRIVVNGYPTGVEVSPAMHHGGPWPATTDARFTSVGTAAILRFARPVCFQDTPQALLPEELRDPNPRGLWRLVDGGLSRQAL